MRGARVASISLRGAIAACAAGCVAACFGDRGVAVQIDIGDTGATKVELYIGKEPCNDSNVAGVDCTSIAPPDGTIALRGDIWFRDDPLPYTVAVNGRTATFQLRSEDAVTLPILVAVGLVPGVQGERAVGSATLRDVAIPVHGARIDTATLVAASPVLPKQVDNRNLTEDRVLVWTKQTPPSSCVVVEHWQGGQVTRDFVVPAEDPDCDDVKQECNPMAWRASTPAGFSRPDCFASGSDSTCLLASHACVDDGGRTGSCAPQREQVCAPEKFCGCDIEGPCMQSAIDSLMTPRIDCFLPGHPVSLGLALCPGMNTTTIDLAPMVQARCEQPLLGSLQLGGFSTSHSFGGATIELSSPSPACSFGITWKSDPRTASDAVDDHGLIAVPFTESKLLVPIVFHFTPGTCTLADKFFCQITGNASDPVWSCAH